MSVEWVEIGPCRLACGDCLEILPTLEAGSVDAVVTDPGYGLAGHSMRRAASMLDVQWDSEPASQAEIDAILSLGVPSVIWGGNYFNLPPTRAPLVWDKVNDGRSFADVEIAWTNLDMVARKMSLRPQNMDGGKVHPYQKPLRVIEWCLSFLSAQTTVLDPFMGSGTTGVACVRTGRRFIGIELCREYFDIACRRIERAVQDAKCDLFRDEKAAVETQREMF